MIKSLDLKCCWRGLLPVSGILLCTKVEYHPRQWVDASDPIYNEQQNLFTNPTNEKAFEKNVTGFTPLGVACL